MLCYSMHTAPDSAIWQIYNLTFGLFLYCVTDHVEFKPGYQDDSNVSMRAVWFYTQSDTALRFVGDI